MTITKTINLIENDNQINKQPEHNQSEKPKTKIIFFDDADDQFGE